MVTHLPSKAISAPLFLGRVLAYNNHPPPSSGPRQCRSAPDLIGGLGYMGDRQVAPGLVQDRGLQDRQLIKVTR